MPRTAIPPVAGADRDDPGETRSVAEMASKAVIGVGGRDHLDPSGRYPIGGSGMASQ